MMGLESSTSDLSSDAQNRATTEFHKQTKQGASSVEDKDEGVTRGGSLDGSRGVETSEKPGESAEEDEADATRNGSLDNARGG